MQKKTVISVMIVAMLLVVALYFVSGTYARYVSEFTGDAKVTPAKWSVSLSEGGAGQNLTLNLTPETATGLVVDGKIAPSYSASAKAVVSLDGTEVAVDVFAYVDEGSVAETLREAGFETHPEDIKLSATVEKNAGAQESLTIEASGEGTQEKPYVIKLPGNAAFQAQDKLDVTIKVTWDNAEDKHNEEHTTVGTEPSELTIPAKLYVVQHIEENPFDPATVQE